MRGYHAGSRRGACVEIPWVAALVAGAIAQALKLLLGLRTIRSLGWRSLWSLPGMPSTWAAMCGALCTLILRREGWASPLVAGTVAYSCLVLYDDLRLRRSAGRQARLLNAIARDLELKERGAAGRHLRELLGETPAQVLAGISLGIAIALPWPR